MNKILSLTLRQLRITLYYLSMGWSLRAFTTNLRSLRKKDVTLSCQPGFGDVLSAVLFANFLQRKGWKVSIVIDDGKESHKLFPTDKYSSKAENISRELIDFARKYAKCEVRLGNGGKYGCLYAQPILFWNLFGEELFTTDNLGATRKFSDESSKSGYIGLYPRAIPPEHRPLIVRALSRTYPAHTLVIFGSEFSDSCRCDSFPNVKSDAEILNAEDKGSLLDKVDLISRCEYFVGSRGGFGSLFAVFDIPGILVFDRQGVTEMEEIWSELLAKKNILHIFPPESSFQLLKLLSQAGGICELEREG